jgi:hypothetical protein
LDLPILDFGFWIGDLAILNFESWILNLGLAILEG